VKMPMNIGVSAPLELLLPERAVTKLTPILTRISTDSVAITPGEGSIQFEAENFRFQSKLITEKFPEYERVLPMDNDLIMIADTQELVRAVRLMGVVCSPITSLVRFAISKGALEFFASDLDAGTEGSASIAVDYDGEPFSIGFNSKMLLEILRHIPTDQVRFAIKGPAVACLLTPLPQSDEYEYTTVVMPLRLPGD